MYSTCHVGANTAAHPGQAPNACTNCHTFPASTTTAGHVQLATPCATCHTGGSSDFHAVKLKSTVTIPAQADCIQCHVNRNNSFAGVSPTFIRSAHYDANGANPNHECRICHGKDGMNDTTLHGKAPNCDACHGEGYNEPFELDVTAPVVGQDCKACHGGGGHPHGILTTGVAIANNKTTGHATCIGCHASVINHPGDFVKDNSGVRAITTEFTRNSHHVVKAGGVTDADCAVCHAEGSTGGAVNSAIHMKDEKIYLRNCNTSLAGNQGKASTEAGVSVYAWNPATPDHTLMDQFCFSCHNSGGAPQAAGIVTGGTAANPFNDTISNGYDQLARPAVVAVFEQFDTNNTAHHAVRGQKYSVRSREDVDPEATNAVTGLTNDATFTQYSGATAAGKYPGKRETIYEAGLFVATYTPLGASESVADNSTLHCGDCHTVGQFKAGSTTNAAGVATTASQVIGAHGSVNEYMLRTSTGTDALHHHSDNATGNVAGEMQNGTYVCFLCHSQTVGDGGGYNALGFHGGIEGGDTSYCNGKAAESVGLSGWGGTFKTTYDANKVKTGQTRVPNIIGTNAGGNVFGYTCAHCHNSGQNNTFGGIHGGSATFKSYSTNGSLASATNPNFVVVQKKPYRFLGGLSNRYNGGGDAGKWEAKTVNKANREGCYNQSTAAVTAPVTEGKKKLWSQDGIAGDDAVVQPTGTNGTWGSCSHHSGTLTSGGGTAPTREFQRPLAY